MKTSFKKRVAPSAGKAREGTISTDLQPEDSSTSCVSPLTHSFAPAEYGRARKEWTLKSLVGPSESIARLSPSSLAKLIGRSLHSLQLSRQQCSDLADLVQERKEYLTPLERLNLSTKFAMKGYRNTDFYLSLFDSLLLSSIEKVPTPLLISTISHLTKVNFYSEGLLSAVARRLMIEDVGKRISSSEFAKFALCAAVLGDNNKSFWDLSSVLLTENTAKLADGSIVALSIALTIKGMPLGKSAKSRISSLKGLHQQMNFPYARLYAVAKLNDISVPSEIDRHCRRAKPAELDFSERKVLYTLASLKFFPRPRAKVGGYFLDFVVEERERIINLEYDRVQYNYVNGDVTQGLIGYDQLKERFATSQGFKVVRVSDKESKNEEELRAVLLSKLQHF